MLPYIIEQLVIAALRLYLASKSLSCSVHRTVAASPAVAFLTRPIKATLLLGIRHLTLPRSNRSAFAGMNAINHLLGVCLRKTLGRRERYRGWRVAEWCAVRSQG